MKKLFRIPIIVILFLGGGFLYVVKNPSLPIAQKILTTLWISTTISKEWTGIDITNCTSYFDGCNTCMVSGWVIGGCTRMYCETPTQPKCLEYVTTGTAVSWSIDLTNCVSYFDGCNNCSVKDGKPDACTLMYCETPGTPKCNQYKTGTIEQGTGNENQWTNTTAGIANPASTHCINNWWTLNIVTSSAGGQVGMCTLKNWTVCEERAFMRGECWSKNTGTGTSPGNPWSSPGSQPVACSMIAKLCPDGSSVGRSWPNCEFAPCPWEWTVCTQEYAPVCASVIVDVECIRAPCPSQKMEQTFGNKCMMNTNKQATFLHDGECAK